MKWESNDGQTVVVDGKWKAQWNPHPPERKGGPALVRQYWGGTGDDRALGGTPQVRSPCSWGRQGSFFLGILFKTEEKNPCQFIAKSASAPVKPVEEVWDPTLWKINTYVSVHVHLCIQMAQGRSGFVAKGCQNLSFVAVAALPGLHQQQVHPSTNTPLQHLGCWSWK